MVAEIKKSYPLAQQYLEKVYVLFYSCSLDRNLTNSREIFEESDTDHDNHLRLNEVVAAFQKLQSKITSYPAVSPHLSSVFSLFRPLYRRQERQRRGHRDERANQQTAQVAAQQGKYLAKMYGKLAQQTNILDANEMPDHDDELYYKPFKYLHLGTLAYIGNSSVPPHIQFAMEELIR
jgi:hypothetical protein